MDSDFLSDLEYIVEQRLSGHRTYFRGIRTESSADPDVKSQLCLGVLYMTSHFGYALGYALDIEKNLLKDEKGFKASMEVTGKGIGSKMNKNLNHWIFPMKIHKFGDVFNSHSDYDKKQLWILLNDAGFVKKYPKIMEIRHDYEKLTNFAKFLASRDWLMSERDIDTMLGVRRQDLINLLASDSRYDGYWNHEHAPGGPYSAIGIFEKSLGKLSINRPFLVKHEYAKDGREFLNMVYS